MPKLTSLLEIVLFVEEIDRSTTFYKAVMGLPQSRDGVFVVATGQLLLLAKQGTTAVPKQLPGGTIPTCGAVGSQHVAFAVAAADFESWRSHLLDHGITDLSEVNWSRGGRSLYFRDPDGHLLELATPGLWDVY